ncbi:MAG: NADH-quinone oxidoreductase subunit NuoK [Dehalococcoidia bacterium]
MDLERFLILSAVIFCIGLYGTMARRNLITILMSLELMFTAVTLAAVAMSRYVVSKQVLADTADTSEAALQTLLTGQVFALFIIVVAAAEIALGLGIVIAFYRSRETVDMSQANMMSR